MKEQIKQLESIVRMTQKELKRHLKNILEQQDYHPVSQKGFLYAPGEVPVLLVAHLDTVHKTPVENICYSPDGKLMMSPEGIGGDDRCGVLMVLEIIKAARCHILFCEDEETGCQGARAFANSKIRPDVNYIVEMDRRGANDAVFYRCDNEEFTDFICEFGFDHAHGSFSDICVVAPRLGVAAVNISAGYYFEHSRHEYIDIEAMSRNIQRIIELVQTPSERFDYLERIYSYQHTAFEELTLWDLPPYKQSKAKTRRLMPLPEGTCLSLGGYETDDANAHLMDSGGGIYRFIPDLEVAVLSESAEARLPTGEPLIFDRKQAKHMRVVPLETALELLYQ